MNDEQFDRLAGTVDPLGARQTVSTTSRSQAARHLAPIGSWSLAKTGPGAARLSE